jgi:cytochrome oxidase Cu insertion factor (SCO1/SenC/PrrC family)
MTRTPSSQRALTVILVALVAAIVVVVATRGRSVTPQSLQVRSPPFDGPVLPAGARAADFTLADQDGREVTLSRYRGHVIVLTFIHSLCHDACPFMVEQIKGALNSLGPAAASVPAIGVSVAPSEDTPAHRREFLAKHEMTDRFAFLSGRAAALRRVWRAYGIQPVEAKLDHSTFVLLIDKRGFERVGFPADQLTPEDLAHDIRVLEREA